MSVRCKRDVQEQAYIQLKAIRASNGGPKTGDIDIVVDQFSDTPFKTIVTYRTLRYLSDKDKASSNDDDVVVEDVDENEEDDEEETVDSSFSSFSCSSVVG